jgi:hypothetical protein
MTKKTSSARQLHRILDRVKKTPGDGLVAQSVFYTVLEATNLDEFSEQTRLLFSLFNDTCQDARNLENNGINSLKFIRAIDSVQSVLVEQAFSAKIPWNSVCVSIKEDSLGLIESCAEHMESKSMGYIEIPSDELDKLKEEIHSLINEILKSDLKEDVKFQIISALQKIEKSILNYLVKGTYGVAKSGEEAIGEILSIPSFQNNEPEAETENMLIKRASKFALAIVSVCKDGEAVAKVLDRFGWSDDVSGVLTQVKDMAIGLLEGTHN